jgi:hypothetical protein
MAKEEERKKEEVPKTFVKTVNEFYKSSDIIFKDFDGMHSKYLRGEGIKEDLKKFRSKRVSIFSLIEDIFHKEDEVNERLAKASIEKKKKDKIFEFKKRFSDLADEIDLFVLEELSFF